MNHDPDPDSGQQREQDRGQQSPGGQTGQGKKPGTPTKPVSPQQPQPPQQPGGGNRGGNEGQRPYRPGEGQKQPVSPGTNPVRGDDDQDEDQDLRSEKQARGGFKLP